MFCVNGMFSRMFSLFFVFFFLIFRWIRCSVVVLCGVMFYFSVFCSFALYCSVTFIALNVTVCCSCSCFFFVDFYSGCFILIYHSSLSCRPPSPFLLFISKVGRQGNKVKGLRLVCDPIHFSLHCCWAAPFYGREWIYYWKRAGWLGGGGEGGGALDFPPTPCYSLTRM